MAKKEPLVTRNLPRDVENGTSLPVRRGRVGSVDLYEITDSELDTLEKGSPANMQLNFAVFLLAVAFAAIIALCTAEFNNQTIEIAFIVVSVVGILLGLYFLISCFRNHTSTKTICSKIRNRISSPEVKASKSGEMQSQDTDTSKMEPKG